MSEVLPIILVPFIISLGGGGILLLLIRYSPRPYFYIYATGTLFLLLAAISLLPAFFIDGLWSLPGIGLAFVFIIASFIVFAQANDELYTWKFRQRQEEWATRQEERQRREEELEEPLLIDEVEQGIDWPEVERWLGKQSKKD